MELAHAYPETPKSMHLKELQTNTFIRDGFRLTELS